MGVVLFFKYEFFYSVIFISLIFSIFEDITIFIIFLILFMREGQKNELCGSVNKISSYPVIYNKINNSIFILSGT
jgi:hypothetical protein